MRRARWLVTMVAMTLVAVSCTSGVEIKARAEGVATSVPPATLVPPTMSATTESIAGDPDDDLVIEGCDRKSIGEESGPLEVAYAVRNGRLLSTPCFGEASIVVEAAWAAIAQITPPQLIVGVTIVAGFDDAESDTLAFAGPVADDSDAHLIAVGITAAVDDPQELRLTMAHELAHVFTQTTDQIDVAFFFDECDTFFNGFGCFQPDAYMTEWIDRFWTPAEIESLPDDHGVDLDGGGERCEIDAGFLGSYAASHPEEDFAESFSAFVFDVDLPAGLDARLSFFEAYPEFVEMRSSVRAEGLAAPGNSFGRCG